MNGQDLATILAALRFYQGEGMGEPCNRPDTIHDLATNGDKEISLDAEGIDDLCERLNLAPDGPILPYLVRYRGEGPGWKFDHVPVARFVDMESGKTFARGRSQGSLCTWEILNEQDQVLAAFEHGAEVPGSTGGATSDPVAQALDALERSEYYISQRSSAGAVLIHSRLLRDARAALRALGKEPRGESVLKTADLEVIQ